MEHDAARLEGSDLKKFYIAVAVVLLLLVPVVAWFVYQTNHYKGSEFTFSLDVKRERPLVWFYLTNAGYRQLWMENLDSLTAIGGVPYSKGEKTLVTLVIDQIPYEYTETVTSIDPPTYISWDLEAAGFKGTLTYDLKETEDGGTRLNVERKVRYQTLTSVLLEPFLEKRQRETLINSLQKMKRLVESAPASETNNPDFLNE